MAKAFASAGDMSAKKISFTEVGRDLYAFTAEGDPNTGVIIGDDSVMVVDAQATPVMAKQVVERIRSVTDKPIKYVVLSHYHAVRVLGASGYGAEQILSSEKCQAMIHERGQEDWDSEFGRFPRLFQAADSIPGLTWPTMTFERKMTVHMGKRRVELMHLGRAHTAGDIVAYVPDAGVIFNDIAGKHHACVRHISDDIACRMGAAQMHQLNPPLAHVNGHFSLECHGRPGQARNGIRRLKQPRETAKF